MLIQIIHLLATIVTVVAAIFSVVVLFKYPLNSKTTEEHAHTQKSTP